MQTASLSKAIKVLLFLFLFFAGLYYAKGFLIPLTFAALLSMLLLPLSEKMESKGLHRGIAIVLSILFLVLMIGGLITLLGWQVSNVTDDISKSEQKVTELIEKLKAYIHQTFGIKPQKQEELLKQQQSSSGGKASGMLTSMAATIGGTLVNTVLVIVYIFLLSFYRRRLKNFIMMLVPAEDRDNAQSTISQSRTVAQKYLAGMGMMIAMLWVLYGIGFSLVGVDHAIFFAVLCGTLELVPFVGNLTGTAITVLMAVTQGGGAGMVLGIVAVYAIVQFFQTYILEPLVVGAEVSLNPLSTILALIIGETVWGIPGMILSIPLMGIAKIIFDHVEPLKPYGYLIGESKSAKKTPNFIEKIKGWFS